MFRIAVLRALEPTAAKRIPWLAARNRFLSSKSEGLDNIVNQIEKIESIDRTPSSTRMNELRQLKHEYKKRTGSDYEAVKGEAPDKIKIERA